MRWADRVDQGCLRAGDGRHNCLGGGSMLRAVKMLANVRTNS